VRRLARYQRRNLHLLPEKKPSFITREETFIYYQRRNLHLLPEKKPIRGRNLYHHYQHGSCADKMFLPQGGYIDYEPLVATIFENR